MTIEQKRRELFENWWYCWPENRNRSARDAWAGFNAALDAVVIELPESCKMSTEELDDGYNAGYLKWEILGAIEDTGLGIKVKS